MTFPQTPQAISVALLVAGTWTDITGDVYWRDGITIIRGAQNESSQAAPTRITMTLDNRTGKYSPRNPNSAYFGNLGRNSKVKVYTEFTGNLVGLPIAFQDDNYISCPDSAATSITGDIDVRADIETRERSADAYGTSVLATKWNTTGNQRSWNLTLDNSTAGVGRLVWQWSAAGTATTGTATSDDFPISLLSRPKRRTVLRVTFDVDNGAGGNTATFYYSDTVDGPWIQIGDPVVTAGTTSIFNSTAVNVFGSDGSIGGDAIYGTIYGGKILNGIGGTVVASPDLNNATIGATTRVDAQGNTWTRGTGTFQLNTRSSVRGVGEISNFPPKRDTSGNDAYVQIEASGITRRLGQGKASAATGLREAILAGDPQRYWPLTGGPSTTYGLSIDDSGSYSAFVPPKRTSTNPTVAWTFGSGDLGPFLPPSFQMTNSGALSFASSTSVSANSTAYVAMDFVAKTTSAMGPLRAGFTDYLGQRWEIQVSESTNDLLVVYYAPDGAVSSLGSSAALDALTDGAAHHWRLELTDSGADTLWRVYIDGVSVANGTAAATQFQGMSSVLFRYQPTTAQPLSLGHIVSWSGTAPGATDLTTVLNGYLGEAAGTRIKRICDENSIRFYVQNDLADSLPVGSQYSESLLTQLRDAETADQGMLIEPVQDVGLSYRPLSSLYNQTAMLALDYSAHQLDPPFEPVDDDLLTRNKIFATRRDGGSYTTELTTGRMSTLEPQDGGVGVYDTSNTYNVPNDAQLPTPANWALHLGTLDAARYPILKVNLAAPAMYNNQADSIAAHSVDLGDIITVDSASGAYIYDQIKALVVGYTERLNVFEHTIAFNCLPGALYDVATYATSSSSGSTHYDTGGSTVNGAHNSSTTSLSVATATGNALWTTDANAFPFDINVAGERMTVSTITGASSPQTFTVTRSVNGVTKAQASGADVRLFTTPYYAAY
jgi:hypothetical protein